MYNIIVLCASKINVINPDIRKSEIERQVNK